MMGGVAVRQTRYAASAAAPFAVHIASRIANLATGAQVFASSEGADYERANRLVNVSGR